jgi:hypothetical protein
MGYATQSAFDPRVIYDTTWNRWIITADMFPESASTQYFFIAFSKTKSPTGGWWVYSLNMLSCCAGSGNFWDFPDVGQNADAAIITANVFDQAGNTYFGAGTFTIPKSAGYNGYGWSSPYYQGSSLNGTTTPPDVLDQNPIAHMVTVNSATSVTHDYWYAPGHQGYQYLTTDGSFPVPSWSAPPSAPQPGTSTLVDTSDGRFVNDTMQMGNDLWAVHTVALGGFSAPYWYDFNTATNALTQGGFKFLSSNSYDWNASVGADTAGNVVLNWTADDSVAGTHPSMIAASRKSTDGTNVMGTPINVFQSPFSQTDNIQNGISRWGDYSSAWPDPSALGSFWIANETVPTATSWGTEIAKVTVS